MSSRQRMLAGGVISLLLLAALVGGWGLAHRSTKHRAADDHVQTGGTITMSVSPYQALIDPSQSRKPNETILIAGAGQGSRQFSLDKLSPTATHLILRWDCTGEGDWQEYLDGVLYSASSCPKNTLATADLPLPTARLHPKVMLIKAPNAMYWKITIAEVGGGAAG